MAEDETGGGEGGGKDEPLPFKFTNTAADDKTSGLRTPLRVEEVRVQESLRAWGHKPGVTSPGQRDAFPMSSDQRPLILLPCTRHPVPQCGTETGKAR